MHLRSPKGNLCDYGAGTYGNVRVFSLRRERSVLSLISQIAFILKMRFTLAANSSACATVLTDSFLNLRKFEEKDDGDPSRGEKKE